MRKRDELADPSSCLNRSADDEMLFVICGRDPAAIDTVRHWIEQRIRLGKNVRGDRKIAEAELWIKILEDEKK